MNLESIDVTRINRFVIFQKNTAKELETDKIKSQKDLVYIFQDDGKPIKFECTNENMNEIDTVLKEYLTYKLSSIDTEGKSIEEIKDLLLEIKNSEDLIAREDIERVYQEDLIAKEDIENIYQEEDNEEEKEDDPKRKKLLNKVGKGVAIGALTTAAIAAVAAYVNKEEEEEKKNIDYSTADFETIMESLPKDSNQRKFFESVFETTTKINGICGQGEEAIIKDKAGNPKKVKNSDGKEVNQYYFSLAEDTYTDKDGEHLATLNFSPSEIIAAKLILNDYTPEQIAEIVGNIQLDVEKLESDFSSFTHKMFIYSMNGKAITGIGELIDNPEVRETFEQIEQRIVAFNLEPSQDKADKLIRDFAEFFTDGGKTGNKEYSTTAYVLANMVDGYRIANSNRSEYLTVSSKVEEESYSGSGIQKGASLKFYLDEATGVCKDAVTERIASNSESLKGAKTVLLTNIAEELVDVGKSDLANEVMSNNYIISEELKEKIINLNNVNITNSLESYNSFLVGPNHEQIRRALNDKFTEDILTDIEDEELVNNRIYVDQKILNSNNITEEKFNNMSEKERIDYARENGTATTEEKVVKKEVAESELTNEEQNKAIEAIKGIMGKMGQLLPEDSNKTEMLTYKGVGFKAAGEYTDEDGAYKYSGTIVNKTNPDYPDTVYANGRWQGSAASTGIDNDLDAIASAAYAFNGEVISSSEAQIQARLASDVKEFQAEYGTESWKTEAFKEGWMDGIAQELSSAIAQGKITREEAIELYEKARGDKNNTITEDSKKEEPQESVTTPSTNEITPPSYDNPDSPEERAANTNTDTSNDEFVDVVIGDDGMVVSNYTGMSEFNYATPTDAPDEIDGLQVKRFR